MLILYFHVIHHISVKAAAIMQIVTGIQEKLVPQTSKYGLGKGRTREGWKHCLC